MAPPRPSSPKSLLWAHQLKREHTHLLKRMQDLESTNEKQDSRIKNAESAAKVSSSSEIATLAKQVTDLDGPGLQKRLSNMEDDVSRKIDDVQGDSEAMTIQIAALQKDARMGEEERKLALNKDKALLKRIGEVEEGLKKYEQSLDLMGKRVNGQQLGLIKEQLEELSQRVKREGTQMKMLTESIAKLEEANEDLRKANEEFAEKLGQRAEEERQVSGGAEVANDVEEDEVVPDSPEDEGMMRKKSHKWSGGGADRDIIRQGVDLFGTALPIPQPAPKAQAAPKEQGALSRKSPPPAKKPVPKKKNPVPKSPLTPGPRKSHKWAGGGADRDIIAASIMPEGGRKRRRSTEEESEPPRKKQKQKARKTADGQEIVRSGKGWYEVLELSSPEPDEMSPPPKRGPGRPRKHAKPSGDGSQSQGTQSLGKRRTMFPTLRDSEMALLSQNPGSRQTRKQKQAPDNRVPSVKKEGSVSPGIVVAPPRGNGKQPAQPEVYFSSPEEGNFPQHAMPASKSAHPQQRRMIKQEDD